MAWIVEFDELRVLSPSQVANYTKCPRKWCITATYLSPAQAKGERVHEAVVRYWPVEVAK